MIAGSLTNLAQFLGDAGRDEAALSAAQESAGLYRELAAMRPEAFLPDQARALELLADCEARVGRAEDALIANLQAIKSLTQHFLS